MDGRGFVGTRSPEHVVGYQAPEDHTAPSDRPGVADLGLHVPDTNKDGVVGTRSLRKLSAARLRLTPEWDLLRSCFGAQ